MPTFNEIPVSRQVRVMQIIAAGLLMGVFMFLTVVLIIPPNERRVTEASTFPIITSIAGVQLLVLVPLSIVLPSVVARKALQQSSADVLTSDEERTTRWVGCYQTGWIVGMALLEGTAFLGLIAYMIERQPLALGVAGIALALMALRFPTESGVRHWLEQQTQRGE